MKWCKAAVAWFAVLVVSGVLIAQESAPADTKSASENSSTQTEALLIGPGDLLEISVYDVPELILRTRVSQAGTVSLPLVGEMKFSGSTVQQAQQQLAESLKQRNLVLDPQVHILVAEYATQGISVLGEVMQPGIFPLLGPHRLYDAIAAAGGLSQKASRTVTITHKDSTTQPVALELPKEMTASDPANIPLVPGDTVVIGKGGVVYVVGEVVKPGGFLMENNSRLSVLQAVALAQGPTKFANTKNALIVRRNSQGVQEIPIPLDQIMQAKQTDQLLVAEDIVFLPTSNAKILRKRTGDAAVAAAAAAAIYLSHL
jgi:polysaccharide export outer membrane protein